MTDAPILEMRNISKAFGGVQALRDVSFSCRKGRVHALLGENGAGTVSLVPSETFSVMGEWLPERAR